MKPVLFLFVAMTLLASCNNPSTEKKEETVNTGETNLTAKEPIAGEQCYMFIAVKDTYALKLNIIDSIVKGTALFKNFEKDSNHGTLEGEVKGDTMHLWYSFQSEGMNSVRELYFKKQEDGWVTGIAEEKTRMDTAYIPDANTVNYTGPVYGKAACSWVPKL